ncbi:periphilin-1 [Boleophthalmus pectinirostris]|uniref:periphilin-1 n=1 Tax=Boleophthalmus pectinirostris TaxID=150288 RepID=UPI000A1C7444|nr:periphilin-1 [Boleophthalmus pectinirostris]
MDHNSTLHTPQNKVDKRLSDISETSDKVAERAIRRVRSPSRPRAWLSRSYKPKLSGKFHKFGREDHAVHKSGFVNNQRWTKFKSKFYFNRRPNYKPHAPADRDREERYEERKSVEGNSPSKQNSTRAFQPRSSSSRDKDQHSGSKSDKSQSRERDHRANRSRDPDTDQSSVKQAAARDRAIQKKRKEIDEVYYQECEMFGLVVKMLIAKDPSLEVPIQASLRQNLRDIGARCVQAMEKFIADYDSRELSL